MKSMKSSYKEKELAVLLRPIFILFKICTKGDERKTSCHGDSGSPLIQQKEDTLQWIQEGIVSYGEETCPVGLPTVFTRLHFYLPWVLDNIN